jgi:hypothetical protein
LWERTVDLKTVSASGSQWNWVLAEIQAIQIVELLAVLPSGQNFHISPLFADLPLWRRAFRVAD